MCQLTGTLVYSLVFDKFFVGGRLALVRGVLGLVTSCCSGRGISLGRLAGFQLLFLLLSDLSVRFVVFILKRRGKISRVLLKSALLPTHVTGGRL